MNVLLPGKDYASKLPKPHLSYSQIEMYLRCPQQYYRRYVLGEKGPVSITPVEGQILAAALEFAVREYLEGKGYPSLQVCIQEHRKLTRKLTKPVTDWNGQTAETVHQRGAAFLTTFYRDELPSLRPVLVGDKPGVEHPWQVELAGVLVEGVTDLVERFYVWDYKLTGSAYRFKNKVDDSLQLSFYAVAEQKEKVGFIVFDTQKMSISLEKGVRDLEKTKKWLEVVVSGVAHGISQGVFPVCNPTENALCSKKWCPYWATCYGEHQ